MHFPQKLLCTSAIRQAAILAHALLICSASVLPGFTQEGVKPSVKKIGVTRYRLGEIEFDAKTREIFFPVTVNKNEGGPMEYLLVHENGKVHESVLTTKTHPLNLQIVLKLLKYQSGKGDVFERLIPVSERKITAGKKSDRGDLLDFTILWENESEAQDVSYTILDGKTKKTIPKDGWVYTGSEIIEGKYMAELEGSFIAVYLDPIAMFNMTREGADDDERWGANPESIPEIGTRGTLVLRLSKEPDEL